MSLDGVLVGPLSWCACQKRKTQKLSFGGVGTRQEAIWATGRAPLELISPPDISPPIFDAPGLLPPPPATTLGTLLHVPQPSPMPPTRTTRDTPSSPAPRLFQKRARPTSPPLTTPRDTFSLPIGTSDHRILYSPSWTIEYAAELFLETYQLGSEWRQHIGTLLRDEAVPAVERALAASALRKASKENLGPSHSSAWDALLTVVRRTRGEAAPLGEQAAAIRDGFCALSLSIFFRLLELFESLDSNIGTRSSLPRDGEGHARRWLRRVELGGDGHWRLKGGTLLAFIVTFSY